MKPSVLNTFLIIILTLISYGNGNRDDSVYYNENYEKVNASVSYSKMELELLILVNNYRSSIGLPFLTMLTIASESADVHTDYMIEAGQISHDNFSKRSQFLVNKANAIAVYENVANGYDSAQTVLTAWLCSKHHRKNIENPTIQYMGISIERNVSGKYYYTQIFIEK